MSVTLESRARIRALIGAIDTKTGYKHLDLVSAVQSVCDGFAVTMPESPSEGVTLESGGRLLALRDAINAQTGHTDATLTAGIQRLCDGYTEQAPLYSFGALADLHIQYGGTEAYSGANDLQRALTYLRDRVAFTCICGDLVAYTTDDGDVSNYGTTNYMEQYRLCVEQYAGDMPVYECAGNHETYTWTADGGTASGDIDAEEWEATTGNELYYTFTQNGDVFIMLGLKSERKDDLFPDGALEWLAATLEANKDRRCFVFQHVPELADKTADPSGCYSDMLEGTSGQAFVALMRQYPNVVWFHGHTHLTLGFELYPISEERGYKSVHVPSLGSPRFYNADTNSLENYYYENGVQVWGSTLVEGYIVDVYVSKIVVRGIDFAAGADKVEVEPMAEEAYALMIRQGASVLPEGYTQVEYIESTGTQYIDTGYDPVKNTAIEIGYEFTSIPASNFYYVFGNYNAAGKNSTRLMTNRSTGKTVINMFTATDASNFEISSAKGVNTRYDDVVSNGAYTTNGTAYTIPDTTEGTSNSRNLVLFANYADGRKSYMKLYYCRIREGDTLIRDYIPCLDANGVPCLYEAVAGATYYNDGTGSFDYAI